MEKICLHGNLGMSIAGCHISIVGGIIFQKPSISCRQHEVAVSCLRLC